MNLQEIEQDALNAADVVVGVAAKLAAANNPEYAALIGQANAFLDGLNAKFNPAAPAAAATIAQAASDIAGTVAPVAAAVSTVTSGSASSSDKSSAISKLFAFAETIGKDIINLVHGSSSTVPPAS